MLSTSNQTLAQAVQSLKILLQNPEATPSAINMQVHHISTARFAFEKAFLEAGNAYKDLDQALKAAIQIPLTQTELLQCMQAAIVHRENGGTIARDNRKFIALNETHQFVFKAEPLIETFNVISKLDVRKNEEILGQLLLNQINTLIDALKKGKTEQTIETIDPILARINWALDCIQTLPQKTDYIQTVLNTVKENLMSQKITSLQINDAGYHPDLVLQVRENLRILNILPLEKTKDAAIELTPELLKQRLIFEPSRLMKTEERRTQVLGNVHDDLIAFLDVLKYSNLTECHCEIPLRRGPGNLRDRSEAALFKTAEKLKTAGNNTIKISMIGSGGLLQTAIIVAKLSSLGFQKIILDLVDPIAFHSSHQYFYENTKNSFQKLLSDLNFNNVAYEFYSNNAECTEYKGANTADIVYLCDCPALKNEHLLNITNALKAGAAFIKVQKTSTNAVEFYYGIKTMEGELKEVLEDAQQPFTPSYNATRQAQQSVPPALALKGSPTFQ